MVVGALLVAPAGIAAGRRALLEPALLAQGAVVALASSVLPYSLELEALRRIPARVFGVLMSLEPAVAALAGFVVLGQALGASDLVAIGLVVAASAGAAAGAEAPRACERPYFGARVRAHGPEPPDGLPDPARPGARRRAAVAASRAATCWPRSSS